MGRRDLFVCARAKHISHPANLFPVKLARRSPKSESQNATDKKCPLPTQQTHESVFSFCCETESSVSLLNKVLDKYEPTHSLFRRQILIL